MIKMQDLEKTVVLTLYSAYIKKEKAVSLLIVSDRPESGKSEMVLRYYGNRGLGFLSDATAFALWRDFKDEIAKGSLKHLIIPEFLAPLSRKSETVSSFITTIGMLIEEGLIEIHTGYLPSIKLQSPTSIGIIGCMPRPAFAARKAEWELSGFLSRFVLVSYHYDDDTILDIFDSIANGEYIDSDRKIKIEFPDKQYDIVLPEKVRHEAKDFVIEHTENLRKKGKGYGFRELKNVLRFIASNVIYENVQNKEERTIATLDDLGEVIRISYLIGEEFNEMREM